MFANDPERLVIGNLKWKKIRCKKMNNRNK